MHDLQGPGELPRRRRDIPHAPQERPGPQVIQAAVEAALPGATVDWDAATVTHPDGTSDRVDMRCYREDDLEGRRIVVFSFEFPERNKAAVERSISVAEAVAGGRAAHIGMVTLDPDGSPVGLTGPESPLAAQQHLFSQRRPRAMQRQVHRESTITEATGATAGG